MGTEPTPMVCRQCDEVITTDTENCPHCGQATRGRGQWVLMGVGAFVILFSAVSLFRFQRLSDILFILIGAALFGFGLTLLRDKRARIDEGKERSEELQSAEPSS